MQEVDADALLHVFADPNVTRAFDSDPFDRAQMERWVRRNLEHQERYGYGLYAVVLRENNLLIGDCGLEYMEVDGELQAELGYDLRSDYWARGYATEGQGNEASWRVAEKIGMRRERELERFGTLYWQYRIDHGSAA